MLTEKEQKILDEAPDWATHYMVKEGSVEYATLERGYVDNSSPLKRLYWVAYHLGDLRKKVEHGEETDTFNYSLPEMKKAIEGRISEEDLDNWLNGGNMGDKGDAIIQLNTHLVNTTYKNTVCRGSILLGTGCGTCEKCVAEKINNIMKTDSTGFVTGGVADTNHFPDYNSTQKLPETVYNTKPPLGLRPRFIWLEERKREITEALQRQLSAGEDLNSEWIDELKEVNEMIKGDIE